MNVNVGNDTWFVLAIFALAAAGFALAPLAAARLWSIQFSPAKPGTIKNATYECGLEARHDTAVRVRSEYYLCAILFLVFDVEAIFLIPFAVAFTDLSVGAALAMLAFVFLVVEGLVWGWVKGVFRW
ncbi:MAG: NADH-quinone oxidoreductase subunit A [Verrucomicrobia bacterium]|nr:NADH-quinone oxidoreductase subunit A [Verrucomicrobiota bacterium]